MLKSTGLWRNLPSITDPLKLGGGKFVGDVCLTYICKQKDNIMEAAASHNTVAGGSDSGYRAASYD